MQPAYKNHPIDLQTWYNRFFDDPDVSRVYNGVNYPATNIRTTNDGATMTIDLPGVNREDIQITIEKGQIVLLSAERKEEKEVSENESVILRERRFNKYERHFRLPFQINEENTKAEYKNGVLTIQLQKAETEIPRRIAIQPE